MFNSVIKGDCLDVLPSLLKEYGEGFVDLVYIDPPFNTNATWVHQKSGSNFSDKFLDIDTKALPDQLASYVAYLGAKNKGEAAYVSFISSRIELIYKALKDGGSFYLHCDHHCDFLLREVCDYYFGAKNLRNTIIWNRRNMMATMPKYIVAHEVILYYTKGEGFTFNKEYIPLSKDRIESYKARDDKGMYITQMLLHRNRSMTVAKKAQIEWMGIKPKEHEVWKVPKNLVKRLYPDIDYSSLSLKEKLDLLLEAGRISMAGKSAHYKLYLHESPGEELRDVWSDIPPIQTDEILNYPTQKPIKLLSRIVSVSSNTGDVVMDCFCGSGTTLHAAQVHRRRWLGIDKSTEAVELATKRLKDLDGVLL